MNETYIPAFYESAVKLHLYTTCQVLEQGSNIHVITNAGGRLQLDATRLKIVPSFCGGEKITDSIYDNRRSIEVYDYAICAAIPLFLESGKYGIHRLYGLDVQTNPQLRLIAETTDPWFGTICSSAYKTYFWKQDENGVMHIVGLTINGEELENVKLISPAVLPELENEKDIVFRVKVKQREDFSISGKTDTASKLELISILNSPDIEMENAADKYFNRCDFVFSTINAFEIQYIDNATGYERYTIMVYLNYNLATGSIITSNTVMAIYKGDPKNSSPVMTVIPNYLTANPKVEESAINFEEVSVEEEFTISEEGGIIE